MRIIILFVFIAMFFSCSEYQKALKNSDSEVKLVCGKKMYEAKKYSKAIRLFEQIAPVYKSKPEGAELFYMYAQAYYKSEMYNLAAFQFETFIASYPKNEKREEASFLAAKSYSMLSVDYSLDQTDTNTALEKLQNFLDTYPSSEYYDEANQIVKVLSDKLEKKAFENAKLYNTIYDHKAAIVALSNFIINNPGTVYKEDALYYKFDSSYELAINSIPSLMAERVDATKTVYASLIRFAPNTKYKADAEKKIAIAEKTLKTTEEEIRKYKKQ